MLYNGHMSIGVKLAKVVVRGSGSACGREIKQNPCVHFTVERLRGCEGALQCGKW
jgi:hypothetical protein